jgi:hypothetical protein
METSTGSAAKETSDLGTQPGKWWLQGARQLQPSSVIDAISIEPEDYMNRRAVYKINTYERLAKQQKRWYRVFGLVALLGSATVPVLINLDETYLSGMDRVLLTTAISLLVTIAVSIEKLFQFREHWRSYDGVAAALHHEQLQFQARAGVYSEKALEKDPEGVSAFQKFVVRFEGLIDQEKSDRIDWETTQST